MNAAHQVYRQTQVTTAAPGELIVMLYRGAVRFTAAGAEALERGDFELAHSRLIKAQDVVVELAGSLNVERAGPVGPSLMAVYTYLHRELIQANVKKDPRPAREVEKLLRELLGAWEEAVQQASASAQGRATRSLQAA